MRHGLDRLRLAMVVLGAILAMSACTAGALAATPPACFPQFGMPCEEPGLFETLATWIAEFSTLLLWLGYRYLRGRWPFKPRAAAARPVGEPDDRPADWVASAATRVAEVTTAPAQASRQVPASVATRPRRRAEALASPQRAQFGMRR